MSDKILNMFENYLHIDVTPSLAEAIRKYVIRYENSGNNPQALNTYTMGIHKCFFLDRDRDAFLALFKTNAIEIKKNIAGFVRSNSTFGINPKDISEPVVDTGGISFNEMRKWIKNNDAINTKFKVVSDPFNLFCAYLLHKIYSSGLEAKLKRDTCIAVLMILQYKFFTSLVAHRFRYSPDEATFTAVFESLNNKYDLKIYGTWRALMYARAETFIDGDVHRNLFENFNVDKDILYFISDVQTRLRQSVNIITTIYMETKERGDKLSSYDNLTTDEEGTIGVGDISCDVDNMIINSYNGLMTVSKFLDDKNVRMICGLSSTLNPSAFRNFLIAFSEYAVRMQRTGKADEIKTIDGLQTYTGKQIFIQHYLQFAYRICMTAGVGFSNKLAAFKAVRDAISSSRILDPEMQYIRSSTNFYVNELQDSKRESTLSALRISLLLYIFVFALSSI